MFAEGCSGGDLGRPRVMSVAVGERPLENPPEPQPLFEIPIGFGLYRVSIPPDGQRLFAVKFEESESHAPAEFTVVVNWTTELLHRMSEKGR